jgi:hypothetical protein
MRKILPLKLNYHFCVGSSKGLYKHNKVPSAFAVINPLKTKFKLFS